MKTQPNYRVKSCGVLLALIVVAPASAIEPMFASIYSATDGLDDPIFVTGGMAADEPKIRLRGPAYFGDRSFGAESITFTSPLASIEVSFNKRRRQWIYRNESTDLAKLYVANQIGLPQHLDMGQSDFLLSSSSLLDGPVVTYESDMSRVRVFYHEQALPIDVCRDSLADEICESSRDQYDEYLKLMVKIHTSLMGVAEGEHEELLKSVNGNFEQNEYLVPDFGESLIFYTSIDQPLLILLGSEYTVRDAVSRLSFAGVLFPNEQLIGFLADSADSNKKYILLSYQEVDSGVAANGLNGQMQIDEDSDGLWDYFFDGVEVREVEYVIRSD